MNQLSDKISWRFVYVVGALLVALTGVLFNLALDFEYGQPPNRPIFSVVCLSWAASAVALLGLFFGLRVKSNFRVLVGIIVLVAVSTRLLLVFSNPILEVDFYRYLWDGIAANQGVAPYKYSPEAVLHSKVDDPELQVLQATIAQSPSAFTIVSRVHFEQYTTLYPPVSQAVFRATTAMVPDGASVEVHIASIKFVLVLFDFGTMAALGWMLFLLKKHPAWLMAYAWNPLVMKEISNGGHLDSIAIFFMTAAIAVFLWIACQLVKWRSTSLARVDSSRPEDKIKGSKDDGHANSQISLILASLVSGFLLACGVGAKLFPIIFMPAMLLFLFMRGRFKCALAFGTAFGLGVGLVMWPMWNPANRPVSVQIAQTEAAPEKTDGLNAFMTQWRMNDAIFSGIYQNVEYDWRKDGPPWYVFVANETRIKWCENIRAHEDKIEVEYTNGSPAYFIARLLTVGMFGVFYLFVFYRLWQTDEPAEIANLLFLIIGVFFYLQPTQNPWYWAWAMPLVCFAKNKGWLFVSLILFVYYLRFWYTEKNVPYYFLDTKYQGHDFFDHCLVWAEFALVLTILLGGALVAYFGRQPELAKNTKSYDRGLLK